MRRLVLRRVPLVAAALTILLAGAYLLLRDASTFAIRDVEVRGVRGPDGPRIVEAVTAAARDMTILNLDVDALRETVARFPTVRRLDVDRHLPNRLTVTIREEPPVAVVVRGGQQVPIAADGRLLPGATAGDDVPTVALEAPASVRIDDAAGRRLVALVAAAPRALRRRAAAAALTEKGLTMRMVQGPELYFGTPEALRAKWSAAARVLADPSAEGATYIDVRVPARAAAGGLAPVEGAESAPQQGFSGQTSSST
jgi:cell division protein FtsQ